jgi:hypothetical protein
MLMPKPLRGLSGVGVSREIAQVLNKRDTFYLTSCTMQNLHEKKKGGYHYMPLAILWQGHKKVLLCGSVRGLVCGLTLLYLDL